MTLPSRYTDPILRITLTLAEYPIMRDRIRERMRQELFARGIISSQDFEAIAREHSIRSQEREGLQDPYADERAEVWDLRLQRVRDHLTDFYFATNLPYELFEDLLRGALAKRTGDAETIYISFNPELAPKYMLFEQAKTISALPSAERAKSEALLKQIKVVLIRVLISDQLAYVRIAKKWFTVEDLVKIRNQKMGYGKIGGKAAGMLLATSILRSIAKQDNASTLGEGLKYPESYFLGADLMYTFMAMNGLMKWNDQKYKLEEDMRAEYEGIRHEYSRGSFPPDIIERLRKMLRKHQGQPLIVRSSSLLEDNFGTSFAGKYESHFCPNQGTLDENLKALTQAITKVYSSTVNPDALLYRQEKGLLDYDERMAILIQVVEGEKLEDGYFLPHAAGVAFSRNLYRWDPQIEGDAGFLRLVWGLGTRAVDQVGNDYPRLVALSHPNLRPDSDPDAIRRYSQQYVDLIDLEENKRKTLPVADVLRAKYKIIRWIAQMYRDGGLNPIRSNLLGGGTDQLVLTFDALLRRTSFPERMRQMLKVLEEKYKAPVDMEFAICIDDPQTADPKVRISILQCRPQAHLQDVDAKLPEDIPHDDIVFATRRMVPQGRVENIEYVVFVPSKAYFALPTQRERAAMGRVIGRLNGMLEGRTFICVGPGRWGTSNTELGVCVGYSDIYNARALVELTSMDDSLAPEPSFGTHFFQDLMESNTYPLAIYLADKGAIFQENFFYHTRNCLADFLPEEFLASKPYLENALHLIDVQAYRQGQSLELIMDNERGKAVAFFAD